MIQITDDPSVERTAPLCSTHVQLGTRLLLLDPARGRERLMEIQQHDGMVVEVAVISAGLRQAPTRGRGVTEGEGGTRDLGAAALAPLHYISGPEGGAGSRRWDLQGGAAARRVACPPRQVEAPPP